MIDLQRIANAWHTEWSKAYITQVSSGDGQYYIKAKFKTMADMHEAYRAMSALADVTAPIPASPQPNVDEGERK